jgi:hypothetical protein
MSHRLGLILGACLASVLAAAGPSRGDGQNVAPPMAELRQMLQDKNYQPLVDTLTALLARPPDGAYDRGELLMLRGEAELQLNRPAAAASSFDSAAREATQPPAAAKGMAMAALARKAPDMKFVARTGDHRGHAWDITDAHTRSEALAALYADELAAATGRLQAANRATNLTPILQVLPLIAELAAIETTVTGEALQTTSVATDVGLRAHALMEAALDDMNSRVAQINKAADVNKQYSVNGRGTWDQVGLNADMKNELGQIIQTCGQIVTAAHDLRAATKLDELEATGNRAGQTKLDADKALHGHNATSVGDAPVELRRPVANPR